MRVIKCQNLQNQGVSIQMSNVLDSHHHHQNINTPNDGLSFGRKVFILLVELKRLIQSLPRRGEAALEASGDPTPC